MAQREQLSALLIGAPGATSAPSTPNWQQLSRGMSVRFRDGEMGTIEHLEIDLQHPGVGEIVVRLAAPPLRELVVPIDRVLTVDERGVFVDLDSVPTELLSAASAPDPGRASAGSAR